MMFFTNKPVSPKWTVNPEDLRKILNSTVIFLAAPALLYLGQLTADMNVNHVITTLAPSVATIGALQGWLLGVVINFFLKFSNTSK